MGCWNGTCMITNLPILAGEKVKLVFLRPRFSTGSKIISTNSAICYANDLLAPAFLPISGEYDDYGCIDNFELDWNYDIILNFFKKQYPDGISADRKEIKDFFLSDVIRGIERGNLKSLDDLEPIPMAFAMIREDVWNGIVQHLNHKKVDYYDDDANQIHELTHKTVRERKFEKELTRHKEFLSIEAGGEYEKLLSFTLSHTNEMFGSSYGETVRFWCKDDYIKYFKENIQNEDVLNSIKNQWMEYDMVEYFVNSTRKLWMIQAGAGSQGTAFRDYAYLGHLIGSIAKKKLKEYDDEY